MFGLLCATKTAATSDPDMCECICSCVLDLERDGPTVVEIPPGCGPGTVNDAFFRFLTDMGAVGPDRGLGGKYLLLPPDYAGLDPPEGGTEAEVGGARYFAAKSKTYVNWLILRGFLVEGRPEAAVRMFKEGLKVYPLSYSIVEYSIV